MGRNGLYYSAPVGGLAAEFDSITGTALGVSVDATATNRCWPSICKADPVYYTVTDVPSIFTGQTARKFVGRGTGGAPMNPANGFSSSAAETVVAWGIFEKDPGTPAGTSSQFYLYRTIPTTAIVGSANINWDTGTVSGSGVRGSKILSNSGPNGGVVVLIWTAYTIQAGETVNVYPHPVATNGAGQTGQSVINHHLQFETGLVPSPPIITTTAQATRSGDTLMITDLRKIAFNQQEGTFYVDCIVPPRPATTRSLFEVGDGTLNNRMYIGSDTLGQIVSVMIASGQSAVTLTEPAKPIGSRVRAVVSYKAGAPYRMSVNGGAIRTSIATPVIPPCSNLSVGGININGSNQANTIISESGYFPMAKNDAELMALSAVPA